MKVQLGLAFRNFSERQEEASSCLLVLIVGVGNEYMIVCNQPAVSVYSAKVSKVQHVLRLSGRITRVVAVVGPYGNYIVFSVIEIRSDVCNDRKETSEMFFHQLSVNPYL